jgi:hypothetical protein
MTIKSYVGIGFTNGMQINQKEPSNRNVDFIL